MNFKIIIIALLTSAVLCAAIFLSTHGEPFGSPPQAVGGLLNLEDLDFESSGVVPLNGEWQFYDEQFLSFDQEIPVEGNTISVPGLWNKARKSGAFGYGTSHETCKQYLPSCCNQITLHSAYNLSHIFSRSKY
jgi:two-component system sensor histidine kinase ChiS